MNIKCAALALLLLFSYAPAHANSFLSLDAPTIEFTVEGMDYKEDLDVFVWQERKVWIPLGELWFWATARYTEGRDIELIVEIEGEGEENFVFPLQGRDRQDFWEAQNHIFVRLKIMHSDCFHGSFEVESTEQTIFK